jgi:hypothetical protein
LNCVPPTVSYDKDYNGNSQTFELDTKPVEYSPIDNPHHYERHSISSLSHGLPAQMPPSLPAAVDGTYTDGIRMYQTAPYVDQQPQEQLSYHPTMPQGQIVQQNMTYPQPQMYSEPSAPAPPVTMTPPATEGNWRNDTTSNLAEALGELKIDHTAIGEMFWSVEFLDTY